MQYSLGIDIGKKGALVILQKNKDFLNIHSSIAMPILSDGSLNMQSIMDFIDKFKELGGKDVCMEKIVPIFGISKSTYGVLKHQEGIITALCSCKSLNLIQVPARGWQEFSFKEIDEIKKKNSKKRDTKAMALRAAIKYFPKASLVFGSRATVPHDGLVDALLIARYIILNHNLLIINISNN